MWRKLSAPELGQLLHWPGAAEESEGTAYVYLSNARYRIYRWLPKNGKGRFQVLQSKMVHTNAPVCSQQPHTCMMHECMYM